MEVVVHSETSMVAVDGFIRRRSADEIIGREDDEEQREQPDPDKGKDIDKRHRRTRQRQ